MEFRTTLLLNGKTATGVEVPADVVAGLGAGKRPAVHVTINGFRYRSTVAPMGGVSMLPVSAEVRASAGIAAGDEVSVRLEPDTAPREVEVPPELAALLDADPVAQRAFAARSNSRKQQLTLPIADAKTDETRQRRLAKAMETLRGG